MTDPRLAALPESLLLHGTTIAIGADAALLRGASGSGKSDLALRFLADRPAWPASGDRRLVADDQTLLRNVDGALVASSPETIAGRLEIRGVGIVEVPSAPSAHLRLVVDLVGPAEVERLPELGRTVEFLSCQVPVCRLAPFEPSAALKLAVWLHRAVGTSR